jgi:ATP-dependent Clp protease ATP-binding subunit ClpC
MLDRFTPQARDVISAAHVEAREMQHRHIGTEHLLVALAGEVELIGLGLDRERARAEVVKTVGLGEVSGTGERQFTEAAKQALEDALGEAMRLGQREVQPGHLLLAVLKQRDGVARRILVTAGATPSALRDTVVRRLTDPPPDGDVMPVVVRGEPLGDLGHPRVDARLLAAILDRDGAIAAWLRERGVTEDAVRRLL